MKKILISLLLLLSFRSFSQQMTIVGSIRDTALSAPLSNAVVMAIRLKDSVMIKFVRSDINGRFALQLPIDTVEIVISHSHLGDQIFYVFGSADNHSFDFGEFVLPPENVVLNEVVIYAYKDPVYYRGDTLIYTADSFKVKPNATVEDLLKKLPGVQVDASGKITVQGKQIDQLLVDGDEFFGSDPTIATQNLNANTIQSVQVYEQKGENTGSDETKQIMDLKLKEDSKKGYFGKVSGASDFQHFYEGEFLANKFKNKFKLSASALTSNTPKSNFGWSDIYKFGLTESELNFNQEEEMGNFYRYSFNDENHSGIPRTLRSGIYYTDKPGKNTKILFNYSFNTLQSDATTQTSSDYFFPDTTYKTHDLLFSHKRNDVHSLNFGLTQNLDSFIVMELSTKLKYGKNDQRSDEQTDFMNDEGAISRTTHILNTSNGTNADWTNSLKFTRKFRKRDRVLNLNLDFRLTDTDSKGNLLSDNVTFNPTPFYSDSVNQQKQNISDNMSEGLALIYTEPFTKKIKIEFSYELNLSSGTQDKKTFDFVSGEYGSENPLFSNNFQNTIFNQRFGMRLIFEVKKYRLVLGSKIRQLEVRSTNLETHDEIFQHFLNWLPNLNYRYAFSSNVNLRFSYTTRSQQPSITQLQPVPDNQNPNSIRIGNPNLNPSYTHRLNLTYNAYKAVSGQFIWASATFSAVQSDFGNATIYDSLGRAVVQTVNVSGNYFGNGYVSASIPLYSRMIKIEPNANINLSNRTNFINGLSNTTVRYYGGPGLEFSIQTDSIEFSIGSSVDYNLSGSTLSMAGDAGYDSYLNQSFSADLTLTFPLGFGLETDASYNMYSKRAPGYNINVLLWNASLSKSFLKNENLIFSVEATDILNQNITTDRIVQDNVISDTKTNEVGRYILLRVLYKFNSSKTKDTENDMF